MVNRCTPLLIMLLLFGGPNLHGEALPTWNSTTIGFDL